jgi:hypothetical protein
LDLIRDSILPLSVMVYSEVQVLSKKEGPKLPYSPQSFTNGNGYRFYGEGKVKVILKTFHAHTR